jgi:hypothetical protein
LAERQPVARKSTGGSDRGNNCRDHIEEAADQWAFLVKNLQMKVQVR